MRYEISPDHLSVGPRGKSIFPFFWQTSCHKSVELGPFNPRGKTVRESVQRDTEEVALQYTGHLSGTQLHKHRKRENPKKE